MNKYSVRLSKESGSLLFQTIIEAETEKEAFKEAVKQAEATGKNVPNEVWTSIKIIRQYKRS